MYHVFGKDWSPLALIIIIMSIYHALINAMSAHMIHINLNMIFYTHVEHSPTKTISIKYTKKRTTNTYTHKFIHTTNTYTPHTHTHTATVKCNALTLSLIHI